MRVVTRTFVKKQKYHNKMDMRKPWPVVIFFIFYFFTNSCLGVIGKLFSHRIIEETRWYLFSFYFHIFASSNYSIEKNYIYTYVGVYRFFFFKYFVSFQ